MTEKESDKDRTTRNVTMEFRKKNSIEVILVVSYYISKRKKSDRSRRRI
jgi:hypothetical protein